MCDLPFLPGRSLNATGSLAELAVKLRCSRSPDDTGASRLEADGGTRWDIFRLEKSFLFGDGEWLETYQHLCIDIHIFIRIRYHPKELVSPDRLCLTNE